MRCFFEFRNVNMSASSIDTESVAEDAAASNSRGSSASTGLREEYEDLLRYAVVTPLVGGKGRQSTLSATSNKPTTSAQRTELEISKVDSEESSVASQEGDQGTKDQRHPETPHSQPNPEQPASSERPPALTTPISTPTSMERTPTPVERRDDGGNDVGGLSETRHPMNDPEVVQMAGQMDSWCLDLKRNLLAEFEQSRARLIERYQAELHKERQQHLQQVRQLQEEVERCRELMVTYEHSITRKDQVIANITRAIQKQKDKVDLQKYFSEWKIRHYDQARESFTSSLAEHHHSRQLKSRVLLTWFGTIRGRWKQRLEKSCQAKAQEVCVQLTTEYDQRLYAIQRSLDESRAEVVQLRAERQLCEDNMKKAFMRGVCALNLEAMSVFRPRDSPVESANHHDDVADGDHSVPSTGVQTPDLQQAGGSSMPAGGSSMPAGGSGMPANVGQTFPKSVHLTATAFSSGQHQYLHSRTSKPAVAMAPPKSTNGGSRRGQSSKGPPVVVERHVSA